MKNGAQAVALAIAALLGGCKEVDPPRQTDAGMACSLGARRAVRMLLPMDGASYGSTAVPLLEMCVETDAGPAWVVATVNASINGYDR